MKRATILISFILFISTAYLFGQSETNHVLLQYRQAATQYYDISAKNTKEIENLKTKRSELSDKLQQAETKLATAKPVAAKRISKQVEQLTEEVNQLDVQISALEGEIERAQKQKNSLKIIYDSIEAADKQKEEELAVAAKEVEEDSVDLSETFEIEEDTAALEIETDDYDEEEELKANTQNSSSAKDKEEGYTALFTLFVILIGIIISLIRVFKREKCPYCGKKGTLASLGDTRKYQYDENGKVTRTGVLKHYKCSNCGKHVDKIKWSWG